VPEFLDAQQVEALCYDFKLADFNRGTNRALINNLMNGWPPYSAKEEEENNITVNVNDLSGTRLCHDARTQLYGAFLKPGQFFQLALDGGPKHKRQEWNEGATAKMNKLMKKSLEYFETYRSKLALNVLHGVGPALFENRDDWCPLAAGIEDILVPAKTLVTMRNLPFFAIYRSLTAPELIRLTRASKRDPGWNMDLVEGVLEWIDQESTALYGSTWPEVWSPEKMQERVKGDGGFYPADSVPTLDCFDFYFYFEDEKGSGWRRRIILDAWGSPAASGQAITMSRRKPKASGARDIFEEAKGQFLYTSKKRYYARRREEIVTFTFADLSAVAPFQYHSVRSLGFLVYALCHLQNRVRCRFNEAVFEALMMYFKVKTMDDAQRALKLNLVNRGFIDDTMVPLTAAERYQVNTALVELGLQQNTQLINQHAASFSQNTNLSQDRTEKTRYQVMAEVNAMTNLISGGLNQAYAYQTFEDQEVVRRFFKPNTKNADCQEFQGCLARMEIPKKYWVPEAWEVQHAGNQTLEQGIAEWLMTNREKFDPDPQRIILRKATFAATGDAAFADQLVPVEQELSSSVRDAQRAAGSMWIGLPVGFTQGVNHQEYAEALMSVMTQKITEIAQRGNVANQQELQGLQNLAGMTIGGQPIKGGNGAMAHIQILAGNPNDKSTVKKLSDELSKLMNLVRAFAQRLQQMQQKAQKEQQQQQASGNGQMDPKDAAKIAATQATAQAKVQNMRQSHALKTAQRQIAFEQQQQQREQEHATDMGERARTHKADLIERAQQHKAEMVKQRMSSLRE
jgi:hypothetical protein